MAKKALMTASVASMLDNFNRGNIRLLREAGYEVTLAANFDGEEDSSPPEKIRRFREEMEAQGCRVVQIDFSRKIGKLSKQRRSFRQLKTLAGEDFRLVHCNSPICAAMTRVAFRKKRRDGVRVIYTAHGFHFFKGAPFKNWLIYFPVEWICAHWTDILNTVNEEDYLLARKWMKAGQIVRLPGVGIDLERFAPGTADCAAVRRELGIGENETVLLSVGELLRRKNQIAVIRALKILDDPRIVYVLCGRGEAEAQLRSEARKLDLEDRLRFLGFREDIAEICQAADLFVFPSLQEGLPMALLEALAVGTPAVCSDIRGNRELVRERQLRFDPGNAEEIADCIRRAIRGYPAGTIERHLELVRNYRKERSEEIIKREYAF